MIKFLIQKMEKMQYWFQQLRIMLKKNWILLKRNWKSSLTQLFTPLFFVILLKIMQVSFPTVTKSSSYPAFPLQSLPIFEHHDKFSFTLLFAPNTKNATDIVDILASKNHLHHNVDWTISKDVDIAGFRTNDELLEFIGDHPNTTFAAVYFNQTESYFTYVIYYNETNDLWNDQYSYSTSEGVDYLNQIPTIQKAVDEAIIEAIFKTTYWPNITASIDVMMKKFPKISVPTSSTGIIEGFGIFFYFSAAMFNFTIILNYIVYEKENKLREGMRMMGLKDSVFWVSWFIPNVIFAFISTLSVILGGMALDFDFFRNCNFFVNFFVFFVFGISVIPAAFLFSVFISRTKTAIVVGFFVFFIAAILTSMPVVVFFSDSTLPTILRWIFTWFTPFQFVKSLQDINLLATNQNPGFQSKAPGYHWSDFSKNPQYNKLPGIKTGTVPSTLASVEWMLLNTLIYIFFTWYLDNIFPGEFGTPKPFYFPFSPSYWGLTKPKIKPQIGEETYLLKKINSVDEDVAAEKKLISTGSTLEEYAIVIRNLCKSFYSWKGLHRKEMKAVDDLCLAIEKGQLFCLLGHNGAGKTTTIRILSGLFSPTSGDATIFGRSVLTDMDEIRRFTGVCPQHDILWNELTAKEHLVMFAEFKGLSKEEVKKEVQEKLEEVNLTYVANVRAGTYSGGMKRRLSVAISGIGNPQIIFMDEPTTGMDPANRRAVWDMIQSLKKNRVIILTTHSMEEADMLSDRIGIMAAGELKAIGNSLHLKNRFGDGYHISLLPHPKKVKEVKKMVSDRLMGAKLTDEAAGSLVYTMPLSYIKEITGFLKYIETENNNVPEENQVFLKDWSISHTTLEEVFLKLTKESNYTGGRKSFVPLDEVEENELPTKTE